jgi:hypothetical protein
MLAAIERSHLDVRSSHQEVIANSIILVDCHFIIDYQLTGQYMRPR